MTWEETMPLFLIEREFAEQLDVDGIDVKHISEVNTDVGVRWIHSFLSADKKKTYCLYEAPSAEAVREAARRLSLPANAVVEVSQLQPEVAH
jgi:hypothetical protein